MITKKQQEMDIKKWNDSQRAGYDTCGTYDFCSNCDKTAENPCDKASKASKAAKPAAKKTASKKSAK
ncbi:MAG: hypothetical protein OSJ74_02025 [Clostridia bacterium]|nr:hypothetical protein [Clostridia bacterium]